MEIKGKIVQALEEQTGNGRNGVWRKKEYILETSSQYPKKVCVAVWGDKIDQFGIQPGDEVNLGVEIESREYNGRWYTDVRAWKAEKQGANQYPESAQHPNTPDVTTFNAENDDETLPF